MMHGIRERSRLIQGMSRGGLALAVAAVMGWTMSAGWADETQQDSSAQKSASKDSGQKNGNRNSGQEQSKQKESADQGQGASDESGRQGDRATGQNPVLGVQLAEAQDEKGLRVLEVHPRSPAAKAGIQRGDLILRIGDKDVSSPDEVGQFVRGQKLGSKVTIKISREGEEKNLTAVLNTPAAELQGPTQEEAQGPERGGPPAPFAGQRPGGSAWLGIGLEPLSEEQGILVARVVPNSPAAKAGLKPGDKLQQVEGNKISSVADLFEVIEQKRPDQKVAFVILRDGKRQEISATLGSDQQLHGMGFRGGEFGPGAMGQMHGMPQHGMMPHGMMQHLQQMQNQLNELSYEVRRLQDEVYRFHPGAAGQRGPGGQFPPQQPTQQQQQR